MYLLIFKVFCFQDVIISSRKRELQSVSSGQHAELYRALKSQSTVHLFVQSLSLYIYIYKNVRSGPNCTIVD